LVCSSALSLLVKTPVLSHTMSTPDLPQGISLGSLAVYTSMGVPLTMSLPLAVDTVPGKRPCTLSYESRYTM